MEVCGALLPRRCICNDDVSRANLRFGSPSRNLTHSLRRAHFGFDPPKSKMGDENHPLIFLVVFPGGIWGQNAAPKVADEDYFCQKRHLGWLRRCRFSFVLNRQRPPILIHVCAVSIPFLGEILEGLFIPNSFGQITTCGGGPSSCSSITV